MLRCSSGSSTGRRASRTWASVTGIMLRAVSFRGPGAGHGAGPGISPTAIGRIPAMDRARPSVPDRVRLGRHRHHLRVRRPHPPRDLPVRPRRARRVDRGGGGRAVRPAPQRRPPPPRQAGGRRATSRSPSAGRRRRRGAPVEALPGHRARDRPRAARPPRRPARHAAGPGAGRLAPARAEALAEEVGVDYGRAMAAALAPGSDAPPVASGPRCTGGRRARRPTGSRPTPRATATGCASSAEHCPFGGAAIEHPVICAVDRGMVKGMLAALYGQTGRPRLAVAPHGRRGLRHHRRGPS